VPVAFECDVIEGEGLMKLQTLQEKVTYLLDRAQIADVIGCYVRGLDSRDWDLYRSCWTDEITFDFSELELLDEPLTKIHADDWVAVQKSFFTGLPQSQHVKIPIRYDIDGDKAVVLALMQGKHSMPTPTGGPIQMVVGYYRDDFLRTPAGWKMSGLKALIHWNEGNAHVIDENLRRMIVVLKDIYHGSKS
jgi:SnoaL-like domain